MTLEEFKASLTQSVPPADLDRTLQALWQEAKGDWGSAHRLAQSIDSTDGAWVHAYLHRKEGDMANAAYWYSHAGRKMPRMTLAEEWTHIVQALL